jgi:stearoyl-CoA desaturase (delta-9 desaturase)
MLMLAINLVLFGLPGLSIWALQMAWIPFFAAGIVNGVGHHTGYRNFECLDAARNLLPWGIIIGGEELHNNHHSYPTSAKLSVHWWEFDIGWFYIRTLSLLGLATVKRQVPLVVCNPDKGAVDSETIRAFIMNRVDVMTRYTKSVILPVFHAEKQTVFGTQKSLWRRMQSVVARQELILDSKSRESLKEILHKSQRLNSAYHFGKGLQAIWDKSTASQKELVDALQDWCKQAENSDLLGLKEFAQFLKGYGICGLERS